MATIGITDTDLNDEPSYIQYAYNVSTNGGNATTDVNGPVQINPYGGGVIPVATPATTGSPQDWTWPTTTQNTNGTTPGQSNGPQTITPGTALEFEKSTLSTVAANNTGPLTGCIPWTICWTSSTATPVIACLGGQATIPPSFDFNWDFGDSASGHTQNICHIYTTPGNYTVVLKVTDQTGASLTKNFAVKICDVPDVVVTATPQGGTVPLVVELEAHSFGPNITLAAPGWTIMKMDPGNDPAAAPAVLTKLNGSPITYRFDAPGIYEITAIISGKDNTTGLATSSVGTVYVFVVSPTQTISNNLLITTSKFTIDWIGKYPRTTTTYSIPVVNAGQPSNPEDDTLSASGYLILPTGVQLSDLTGRHVRVILNNVYTILDAPFDANGDAVMTPLANGDTGEFGISLPSGSFSFKVRRSLYTQLGVSDGTKQMLVPAFLRIEIDNLYPPLAVAGQFPPPGALITYAYRARGYNAGPPPVGLGVGSYNFGNFTGKQAAAAAPADFGSPGGQEVLLSGVFMVTAAKLNVQGNTVAADLRGYLAPYGGDQLRPRDDSDVVVSLGGPLVTTPWSEALNFNTTIGFKVSGRPPAQHFTFKRSKAMGKTGVAALQWVNQAGSFRIQTNPLPIEQVGLNPALGTQTLTAGLTITPDGAEVFTGTSTFEVVKQSPTLFVKPGNQVKLLQAKTLPPGNQLKPVEQ